MSKLAEKLIILLDVNQGLLCRLYNLVNFRPSSVLDGLDKVVKAITKKFPEANVDGLDKISGWDLFNKRAVEIVPALKDCYETFLEVLDFKQHAWATLLELSQNIIDFQFNLNQDIMVRYLDLLVGYAQVHLLVSLIQDREKFVSVYAQAYKCTAKISEANFSRIASYISDFTNPVRKLQEDCTPLGVRLGDTLLSLSPVIYKWDDVLSIKIHKVFSLLDSMDSVHIPLMLESHNQLIFQDKFKEWVLYGFLLCPSELHKEGARELLKLVLSDTYIVPIFRDLVLDIHHEYSTLFSWYKVNKFKLSKHTDMLREAATTSVSNAGKKHATMRSLLGMDLSTLLNCLKEWQGIIAPKIMMVLAAVSVARSEVLWYFRHLNRMHPKNSKAKPNKADWTDDNVSQLIFLIEKLTTFAVTHKNTVRDYYVEHMSTVDKQQLTPLLDGMKQESRIHGTIKQLLTDIQNEIVSIGPEIANKREGLEAFRLNWYRVSVAISSATGGAGQFSKSARDLTADMNIVMCHSRLVDRLESQFKQFSSLKALWFYGAALDEVFENSLRGDMGQPTHCVAFVKLLDVALTNVHRFCPEEQKTIGMAVLRVTQQYIRKITETIDDLARTIVASEVRMSQQTSPSEAAFRIQRSQEKKVHQPLPGFESRFENKHLIHDLEQAHTKLAQLCTAIRINEKITVFDFEFFPLEFLYDRVVASTRAAIRRISVKGDVIARPSLIVAQLKNLYMGYLSIDNHIFLGIPEIFKHVLLGEFYDIKSGVCGDLVQAENITQDPNERVLVHYLSYWYMHFLQSNLATRGISFSDYWMGFVSRPIANKSGVFEVELFAEQYADINELEALCYLTGPYGFRVIEKDILNLISHYISIIKECIGQNLAVLREFKDHFAEAVTWENGIKRLNNIDKLTKTVLLIGCVCRFRRLLHEAALNVANRNIETIANLITWSHDQIPDNILFNDKVFSKLDYIAQDIGLPSALCDRQLETIMLSHITNSNDQEIFDLIPVIFGAFYTSSDWKDARFNVFIEGHFNNSHCLADAIKSLIIGSELAIFSKTQDAPNAVKPIVSKVKERIKKQLEMFVSCSSHSILHMIASVAPETYPNHHFPSLIVFLEHFVNICSPLLGMNALEKNFPYTIIRAQYIRLYEHANSVLASSREQDEGEKKD